MGKPGSRTVAERATWPRRNGSSRWSAWRCETYRKSGRSTFAMSEAPRPSLRGKTNHEPKKAGTNHGSQTIVPRSRLDQDAGVAERGGAHRLRWLLPARVHSRRPGRASGDGRVGVHLALAGDVLGPRVAVPVPQLVAVDGSGYQPAGDRGGRARGRRRGRNRRRRRRGRLGGAGVRLPPLRQQPPPRAPLAPPASPLSHRRRRPRPR